MVKIGLKASSQIEMDQELLELDALIRKGKQGLARKKLLDKKPKKIPENYVAAFADVARRLNMPKLMLLLLKPVVYPEKLNAKAPTIHQQALYATALSRLGAFSEAQSLLKKIDDGKNAQALLFSAQNFMLQWDSAAAIPKLKKYVACAGINPYSKLVGQVNLGSCLVGEMQWAEAENVLTEVKSQIEQEKNKGDESNYALLHANVLGLLAHAAFMQKDLQRALSFIEQSQFILSGSESRYELLAKKWSVVISLFTHPDDAAAKSAFSKLKDEAAKTRDFETFRDLEFYQALSLRDDQLFLRLYHGTPYASYRKRIKKIYQPTIQIPKMIDWQLNSDAKVPPSRIFDLSKGCEVGGSAVLSKQPLLFKLFQLLTKDFYRPLPLGTLFSSLYPTEKFNPVTSLNRTYLVVKRLRQWFVSNDIPLDIEIENDQFRLVAFKPYTIRVSFQKFSINKNEAILENLKQLFAEKRFSSLDVMNQLGLSAAQTQKFLKWAVFRRKLKRMSVKKVAFFTILVSARK